MALLRTQNLHAQDIRHLQVFVVVASSGGMTAAQPALNMTLSSISTSISTFEKRFGITVCHRGRGGFELTDEGRVVYDIARDLLNRFSSAASEIALLGGVLSGELTIAGHGGDYTHPEYLIPEAVDRFLSRPDNSVALRMEIGSQTFIIQGVLRGDIDVGIGSFPLAREGVRRTPLYEEKASLYCGSRHPLFGGQTADMPPEAFSDFDFVLRTETAPIRDVVPGMRVRAVAPTQEARAMFILSGQIIGFLPDHVAHRWVARGQMKRIGGAELRYASQMELITKEDSRRNPVVEAFVADYAAAVLTATGRALQSAGAQ
ncbi:LysR family transcriptional regulator [Maritimibacter alkaliphilus]|uniref:LysR family transcriptional regulator n=1 Tax=Maritimibacter alkaliphilus TaxID=404236 RepID=UPI001C98CB74|nr:LysR family transcriptional regulator [Maritimibacter alkaliphilus]MBY6091837.1 LysR family transcriptional regulator [Maritimibacter alkaliphilus]